MLLCLVGGQHVTVGHVRHSVPIDWGGQIEESERKLPSGSVFMEGNLRHGHVEAGGDGIPAKIAHRPVRGGHHDVPVRLQRTGERK